jgi:iron complex outermembrane recepter protein
VVFGLQKVQAIATTRKKLAFDTSQQAINHKGNSVKHVSKGTSALSSLGLAVLAGLFGGEAQAEDVVLEEVVVSETRISNTFITQPDASSPATVYQVDREAMRLFDTPGGTNPYTALAELPGVRVSTVDAYGLNNMQGGQKGMRVRGEVSTHGVAGTVEGLALNGPGPGPGYLFLFDKENITSFIFAQGAVSADRPGLFNTYGAIDTRLLWPRPEMQADITTSAGSFNFRRAFIRGDSGLLSSGTSLFVSTSKTSADKWRGEGQAPGNRDNIELGISQQLGDLNIKIAYANNEQAQHNYKALTYQQASNLNNYFYYDFGSNPRNADYYDYNRQDFHSQAIISELEYMFSPDTTLSVKPYYAKEDGYYLYAGSAPTQVLKWLIDHDTYGATAEFRTTLADTRIKLGYAWTSTEPPGPPTARKQYTVANGNLVFQQWALLSNVVERHEFSNVYLTGEQTLGKLSVQAGIRYAGETLPAIDAYKVNSTTGASWDVSTEAAIARATKDPTRSVSSRSFSNWLPQAGVSYQLDEVVQLRANLGRTIGAPSFDAFNQAPAGRIKTSQQYWDQIKPELATNLDIGARIQFDDFFLDPLIYFSRSQNKAVSVFSPNTNTVYSQNVGNTKGQGAQLAAGWQATNTLQFVSAMSYSASTFTENVQTNNGAVLAVDGRQLPDVPKVLANLGAVWRQDGFSVAPIVQYIGPRWATSNYNERIPGYFTTDLTLGYRQKDSWGKWEAALAILNAFDRKYISQISTSDVNTTANGAIYYPGAPRTVVLTLGLNF